jgi:hypothetical protein
LFPHRAGGQGMRVVSRVPLDYRLFFYDGRNHILRIEDVACETDELACARAHVLLDGSPIEVWQAARLVLRIEADGKHSRGDYSGTAPVVGASEQN